MADYFAMDSWQCAQELDSLRKIYEEYAAKGLKLDMSRGKPAPDQLDLSMDLLTITDYKGETGIDSRNYGNLEGMPEARRFFADILGEIGAHNITVYLVHNRNLLCFCAF